MTKKTKSIDCGMIFSYFMIAFFILAVVAAVGFIVLRFILIAKYGDKPITEIPYWVVWVLNDGRSLK